MNDFLSAIDGLRLNQEIEVFLVISLISVVPFLLVATTTFARNVIVLSFLRHALGLQQSPPNLVLITLALFLSMYVMAPVYRVSYDAGIADYLDGNLALSEAVDQSWGPVERFMISQTYEKDLALVYNLSNVDIPDNTNDVGAMHLIPAFLLSELKTAFKIGFIIFLPFLLVDIASAAVLMSLGMIMVPPITISLPLKIMLFVVVDGWSLVASTLIQSVVT